MVGNSRWSAITICLGVVCVTSGGVVLAATDTLWLEPTPVSLSMRPKFGELFVIGGEVRDFFNGYAYGEYGLKATHNHLGVEGSWGIMGSNSYADGKERALDPEIVSYVMKLTATYEMNPMAGTSHRTDQMSAFGMREFNVYAGGGLGYYSTVFDVDDEHLDDYYDGMGLHLVAGAEYFLLPHLGVFGECQYTYIGYQFDRRVTDYDLHGISLMAGFSVKF